MEDPYFISYGSMILLLAILRGFPDTKQPPVDATRRCVQEVLQNPHAFDEALGSLGCQEFRATAGIQTSREPGSFRASSGFYKDMTSTPE